MLKTVAGLIITPYSVFALTTIASVPRKKTRTTRSSLILAATLVHPCGFGMAGIVEFSQRMMIPICVSHGFCWDLQDLFHLLGEPSLMRLLGTGPRAELWNWTMSNGCEILFAPFRLSELIPLYLETMVSTMASCGFCPPKVWIRKDFGAQSLDHP